ncbi:sulfonate dioxygenase, partial [Tremellales sp. Uapishka_1]
MAYTQTTEKDVATHEQVASNVARLHLLGGEEDGRAIKYPSYLPVWTKSRFPDWDEIPYVDPGSRGTPDKRHLFHEGAIHRQLTPALGEEIRGVQLSQLSKEGLDDLALLAAERGLLIFRDQDFKDIGHERQLNTTMGHPEGVPEMHVVYRDPKDSTIARYTKPNEVSKISSVAWHADHTAEIQPPGITFFFALETPESGGDTLFASTTEAYDRLSDEFKKRLEGLQVVHDNTDMLDHSASLGGPRRFSPQKRLHPLVRIHPVTGKKILSIHQAHARRIFGYKQEESDNLFNFLNDILIRSGDLQARAHYEPGTVVVWDNRVVVHTATYDFKGDEVRHVVRIAAMAETPVGA